MTTAKLNDKVVTRAKIGDSAVGNAQLGNNAVNSAKIEDGAVTTAKLPDNSITNPKIADNAISTAKLQDNSVTDAKLNNTIRNNLNILTSGSGSDASNLHFHRAIPRQTGRYFVPWNITSESGLTNADFRIQRESLDLFMPSSSAGYITNLNLPNPFF